MRKLPLFHTKQQDDTQIVSNGKLTVSFQIFRYLFPDILIYSVIFTDALHSKELACTRLISVSLKSDRIMCSKNHTMVSALGIKKHLKT